MSAAGNCLPQLRIQVAECRSRALTTLLEVPSPGPIKVAKEVAGWGAGSRTEMDGGPPVPEELVGLYPCRDRCGLAGTLTTSPNISRNL